MTAPRARAQDYVAVSTFSATLVSGPNEGPCFASCAICRGPITTGSVVHKLSPKRGGSHTYCHQECWP